MDSLYFFSPILKIRPNNFPSNNFGRTGGQGTYKSFQSIHAITMVTKEKKRAVSGSSKKPSPTLILQEFIECFTERGWLNQVLRIQRGERRYRIICNETGFFAYRINENHGISPGIPGWPVCLVTPERVLDDSLASKFNSSEPEVREWLRWFLENDLDFLDDPETRSKGKIKKKSTAGMGIKASRKT